MKANFSETRPHQRDGDSPAQEGEPVPAPSSERLKGKIARHSDPKRQVVKHVKEAVVPQRQKPQSYDAERGKRHGPAREDQGADQQLRPGYPLRGCSQFRREVNAAYREKSDEESADRHPDEIVGARPQRRGPAVNPLKNAAAPAAPLKSRGADEEHEDQAEGKPEPGTVQGAAGRARRLRHGIGGKPFDMGLGRRCQEQEREKGQARPGLAADSRRRRRFNNHYGKSSGFEAEEHSPGALMMRATPGLGKIEKRRSCSVNICNVCYTVSGSAAAVAARLQSQHDYVMILNVTVFP